MQMTDKDWLERVTIAYKEYSKQVSPNLDVERFISWLYKQYGIVEPKDTVSSLPQYSPTLINKG
jgi:hypothetical protein